MTPPDDDLPVAGTVVLLRAAERGVEVLLIRRPTRGSFADAWVFPGGTVESVDRRPGASESDDARRAGIRETFEEVGLVVDDPVPLSRWHPPVQAPVRIPTWFFLAAAPDEAAVPSPGEVAEFAWVTPADALARHGAGAWMMFPPTWMTLRQLAAFSDVGAALAAGGAPSLFRTRVRDGPRYAWDQGELDARSLPWRFTPA
ncbi:NUDIX hydrolase [Microbacterium sp. 179-I 3D3 NHS]|uniref:NUDIX hydrolase n=1 Tax=Microbacterium sp. 179-I 3D3 NHS TaxID=3142382 RepID=UPI0039A2114F